MRTSGLGAMRIERQCVIGDFKTAFTGDVVLALFDFLIVEFLDATTIQAYQVIVVRALVQLKYRLARFEMIAMQQPGLLELCQDAINRRQADVHVVEQQYLVDIFRAEMTYRAVMKNIENLQPREGCFQAAGFQIFGIFMRVA